MRISKKKEDNKVDYGTISLPKPLINKIKKRIIGTGVSSVSSYVAFVLREILGYEDGIINEKNSEDIKKRLKKLGYLD